MKTCIDRARLAVLPLALAAAFPVLSQTVQIAQAAAPQLGEMMVTATRSAQPIGDVVADVTIIDRDVIERSGALGIADVLARVPGFEITRNGGSGSNTSVFVRGGETRHTAVLIDGVRVESQTTSGGASWQSIPLSQIERIEIVRGPTSSVYGSDAVAGVIQIFTKKGAGAFSPVVSYGLGSYGTRKLDMSASGAKGAVDYSFGVSGASSVGFNARVLNGMNADSDGYSSNSFNGRLGFQASPNHRFEATMLKSRVDAQYDGGTTVATRLQDYHRVSKLQTTGLQWQAKWTDSYSTTLAWSLGTDRGEENIGGAIDQSRNKSLLWQNDFRLGAHLFSATIENRATQFLLSTVPTVVRSKSQTGVGFGYGWTGGPHTVQLNVRRDNDSEFRNKSTGSAAYAFALTPQWKLSGSIGTSYRVPTLYQRFSQYGVPGLLPESGRSTEYALRYAQDSSQYGVTVYRNKLTNLLSFLSGASAAVCPSPVLGCYANTALAEYKGVTFSAAEKVGQFRLYGSLDLQDPRDLTTNRQLARRARQHATLGADTTVQGWNLSGDALVSGARNDDVTATPVVLPGYTLLNFSASRPISRDWKFLVRVDNLTDKIYQTANTYAQGRRSLYMGFTWAPL